MKKSFRSLLALLLCLTLVCGCLPGIAEDSEEKVTLLQPVWENGTGAPESASLPFLIAETDWEGTLDVYFFNGDNDLPFMRLEDIPGLAEQLVAAYGITGYTLTFEDLDTVYAFVRDNGSFLLMEFGENNEVMFSDFDLFYALPGAVNGLDVIETNAAEGEDLYLIGHYERSYRSGKTIAIYLDDYQIPVPEYEGVHYLPLQFVSDMILATTVCSLYYNGEIVVAGSASDIKTKLADRYYTNKDRVKSNALTQYTYNELCLALDYCYGLKEEHNITDFDTFFTQTGLFTKFGSADPADTWQGLLELTLAYLSDGHSGALLHPSDFDAMSDYSNPLYINLLESLNAALRYSIARGQAHPEGLPAYQEVGDTAYITFDSFSMKSRSEIDYYEVELENSASDTIVLLMYANEQLHRENCPIKNVVIDLTNNGGGAADAAMCVIAWVLGTATFSLENEISGSQGTNMYVFDANRDRQINVEEDSIAHLNRYCLISPCSFSCGNLVPAAFKRSDSVTMIGRTSGGGACVVHALSTADGAGFCVSGQWRVNSVTNGSYISVDEGVEPDVYITHIETMYDREKLTELIDSLL